jgi:hypothetical protein
VLFFAFIHNILFESCIRLLLAYTLVCEDRCVLKSPEELEFMLINVNDMR